MATSNAHVSALADPDLAQIFKHLPPFDRLHISEVCKGWWTVSRDPWREVTHLELISIPSVSIGAIVRKCPNLTSLCCKDQVLILGDLKEITLTSFKSLELHGCSFISYDDSANKTALPLFRSEYGQSMEELVLHEHEFGDEVRLSERYSQRLLPVSLKRLQLSGLNRDHALVPDSIQACYVSEMAKLRNLECLILNMAVDFDFGGPYEKLIVAALLGLPTLRELLFPPGSGILVLAANVTQIAMNLPKLEIVFLSKHVFLPEDLLELLTKHPTLRIIVIPGPLLAAAPEIRVPNRNRFPLGFAAQPLRLLHVFLGKSAGALFRFDEAPASGFSVHSIDAPFPEYLEREEMRSIFEGSWIAKQIRDAAKRGAAFWKYADELADSV